MSLFPWSSTNTFLHFSYLIPYLPSFLTPAWRHYSYVPRLVPSHAVYHPPARLISLTPLFGTASQRTSRIPSYREKASVFTTDFTTLPWPTFALTHPSDIPGCVLIRLGDPVEQRPRANLRNPLSKTTAPNHCASRELEWERWTPMPKSRLPPHRTRQLRKPGGSAALSPRHSLSEENKGGD